MLTEQKTLFWMACWQKGSCHIVFLRYVYNTYALKYSIEGSAVRKRNRKRCDTALRLVSRLLEMKKRQQSEKIEYPDVKPMKRKYHRGNLFTVIATFDSDYHLLSRSITSCYCHILTDYHHVCWYTQVLISISFS